MSPRIGRRAALAGAGGMALAGRVYAARAVLAATPISRADLRWWRDRHATKLAELRAKQPELLFLGDSITQNWEKSGPPAWRDFQPVWQRFYGRRNAVNLGFTGDTTASLLWRLENGELAGIAPRAAVMLIGANNFGRVHWDAADTLAGIAANIAAFRRQQPRARLLLLGVLPSIRSEWVDAQTTALNTALATRYGAGSTDLVFRDLRALFLRDGRVDPDAFYDRQLTPPDPPLHPTAQTAARMAAAIEPVLAGWLG